MEKFISFILILLLSVADIFLFRKGVLPLEPSLSIIPIFFLLCIFHKKTIAKFKLFTADQNLVFFISIFVLSVLYAITSFYSDIGKSIGLILLTILLYIFSKLFFYNLRKKQIATIFFIAYLILGLSILNDLLFSSVVINRGAGFAENPNSSALRLVFLAIVTVKYLDSIKIKSFVLCSLLFFIFLTLSRSGLVMAVTVVLAYTYTKFNTLDNRLIKKRVVKSTFILTTIFLIFFQFSGLMMEYIPGFNNRASIQRIEQLRGEESLVNDEDQSKRGRIVIFQNYINLFLEKPFGYGTGVSSERSFYSQATHNTFLRLAIDFGILGLLSIIVFLLASFINSIKLKKYDLFIFMLIFLIACFFTNTLLENRTFVISIAAVNMIKH